MGQLEELDYGKLYRAYSPRGRKSKQRGLIDYMVYPSDRGHKIVWWEETKTDGGKIDGADDK